MSKEVKRTLSKKLSSTIMLLAMPIFIVALAIFYRHAHDLLHKEAVERLTTILNSTVQLAVNYITTIETAASSNVWLLEENFTPDSLAAVSRRIVSLNKGVLSCSVCAEPDAFPEYGRYFSAYSLNDGDTVITELEPEFEYFQKNWYKKPVETGRACWINPFSDFNEGTINHHDAVGSYCIPLRPNGDHIAGVVSVDFSFKTLRETVFATHHPYPSSYYMLLGPVGGYLIHPETSLLYKKTIFSATDSIDHPDIIALGREMVSGKHGTMHVTIDDYLCHVCYAPVPNTGWSMALICHDEDVLESYNYLTVIMIVIIIVGFFIIFLLTNKVVKRNIGPLSELMEATERITEGHYDNVLPVSEHKDIIGKLQNAFRKMQLAIMAHSQNVKETTEQIESETAALERTLPLARDLADRKKVFIQNVKRQFNQPLNVINGLANVLQAKIYARTGTDADGKQGLNDELDDIVKSMKRNAIVLHRMTLMLFDSSSTRMTEYSRYEKSDFVSVNQMARDAIEGIHTRFFMKGIRFETDLSDSFCVKTNRLYVMRTLLELIHNAVHYSDGKHILVRVTKTDTAVRYIIEDVGTCLPDNSEELMFVPFTKVDDLSEGLGLGLPLCKGHAKSLGGDLFCDDTYREGCRFIFEIPVSPDAN